MRRLAPDVATDALAAYALAHGKLLTLDRYAAWRRDGLTTYSSLFQRDYAQQERWNFYFRWEDPKGGTIVVTVDTAARAVLSVGSM